MIPGADASRLRTARRVQQEYIAYSDRVYARATGTIDPNPQPPFCLHWIINADGNIQRVVDSPDFARVVLNHLGLGDREEFFHDEDGSRWETISPQIDDYRTAAREAAHIRAELQTRGLIRPRARGQAVTFGFTSPEPSSRTELRPGPGLDLPPF